MVIAAVDSWIEWWRCTDVEAQSGVSNNFLIGTVSKSGNLGDCPQNILSSLLHLMAFHILGSSHKVQGRLGRKGLQRVTKTFKRRMLG